MLQFIRQIHSYKNIKYIRQTLPFIRPHTTNQINTYVKPKNSLLQINSNINSNTNKNINNQQYKNTHPYILLSKISKNLETINSSKSSSYSSSSNSSNSLSPSSSSNCINSNNETKLSKRAVILSLIISIISGGIGGMGVTMCVIYSYNVYDDIAVLFMY